MRVYSWLCILLLLLWGLPGSAIVYPREEVWEQELQYEARNRINLLIKGLDTVPASREKYIAELSDMFKGKLRDLVSQQLRAAMSEGNMQITQGIVEVYTTAGDTAAIPAMINELLYNKAVSVRLSIIQHLPLLCVEDTGMRKELQDILESGEINIPPRLLAAMRHIPFTKDGKYDFSKDQDVRQQIESAISWQLEPVEAVIKYGLEKLNQERALLMLEHLIGVDLGSQRNNWVEFWRSRRRTYISPVEDEIQRTQIAACGMLAAMGAECTKEFSEHCHWVMSTPFTTVRQAVLQMVAQITRLSIDRLPEYEKKLKSMPAPEQSEELWLKRQIDSTSRLRKMIYEFCDEYSSDKSPEIRLELMRCLGSTSEQAAVPYILKLMRADIQSHKMRLLAAESLGNCSGDEAVRVLTQMGVYRGIAVKRELQIMEYQRLMAAFAALGIITGHMENGKLLFTDASASRKAAAFLTESLQDSRRIVGAPPHGDKEQQTVSFLARQTLRESLGVSEKSYSPDLWIQLYNKKASASSKTQD